MDILVKINGVWKQLGGSAFDGDRLVPVSSSDQDIFLETNGLPVVKRRKKHRRKSRNSKRLSILNVRHTRNKSFPNK